MREGNRQGKVVPGGTSSCLSNMQGDPERGLAIRPAALFLDWFLMETSARGIETFAPRKT